MCGRCAVLAETPCLLKIAGVRTFRKNEEKISKRYNLHPYDKSACVPVIHHRPYDKSASLLREIFLEPPQQDASHDAEEFHLSGMRWGLVPSWAKEEKQQFTFNAKVERLLASNMWNRCFRKGRRCIVVLQGFFEWGKEKRPRFVQFGESVRGFSVADGGEGDILRGGGKGVAAAEEVGRSVCSVRGGDMLVFFV